MDQGILYLGGLLVFVALIFLFRLLGAWMLRINEVLQNQERTNKHLETIIKQLNQQHSTKGENKDEKPL